MYLGELTMCVYAQRAHRFYGDETNGCLLLFMSVAASSRTKRIGVQSPKRIIEIVCVMCSCLWWHKVSLCWPLVDAILSDVVSPLSHLPLSRVCESETGESMACSLVFAVTTAALKTTRNTENKLKSYLSDKRPSMCAQQHKSQKAKVKINGDDNDNRNANTTAMTTAAATINAQKRIKYYSFVSFSFYLINGFSNINKSAKTYAYAHGILEPSSW